MTSRPTPELRYLSLGWGVQSYTLAAMMALGEIPRVDVALHADTAHEQQATYDFARRWTPWLEERGVRVVTVYGNGKRTEVIRPEWGGGSVMIPAFSKDRKTGKEGQIRRQCTHDWKIMPMRRHLREQLGGRPRPGSVVCLQGISLDEWHRMRSSDVQYIVNQYPLVDLRMTRADCAAFLESRGLEIPPKSSCTFCPYHSLKYWKRLKQQGGADWDEAVQVDGEIRDMRNLHTLFVHPARVPIAQAVQIPEDYGAQQLEMEMPCDGGVCFV